MPLALLCLLLAIASAANAPLRSDPSSAWSAQSFSTPADDGAPPVEPLQTHVGKVRRNAGWSPQSSAVDHPAREDIVQFVLALNADSLLLSARHRRSVPSEHPAPKAAPAHQHPPGQAPPRQFA